MGCPLDVSKFKKTKENLKMENIEITMHREQVSIMRFLRKINNRSVRLLELSSPFNFDRGIILQFLDSVNEGYAVPVVLVQCRRIKIKSRPFMKDYVSQGIRHYWNYVDPSSRLYVLDGHRRLQTLYSALFGSFDGERLFYDASVMDQRMRFSFSTNQESSESVMRMDEVESVSTPESANWLFQIHNQNIGKFRRSFMYSSQLYIIKIDVEENLGNLRSVEDVELSIRGYRETLEIFLNLLNDSTEASYFRDIFNRLESFLELVQRSGQ